MSRFERRRPGASETTSAGTPPTVLQGDDPFEVSCDATQQDALWKATGARRATPVALDMRATLLPEGSEEAPAIGVHLAGMRVGALDPEDAAELYDGLIAVMRRNNTDVAVRSRVVGGAAARAGDRRQLDVWIYLDPIDFGFDPPALEAIRTGHSIAAQARWADVVPRDLVERVRFLRNQLKAEQAPVQRHLMFNALEDALYRTRDTAPSAFGDYEQAAMAHDSEMHTIIPALLAEFGGVPELPTYDNMARMLERRHRVADAFRWAVRGLELYGTNGTNAEAVEQLRIRTAAVGRLVGMVPAEPAVTRVARAVEPAPDPTPIRQPVSATSPPANWYPDPTGRNELRFWDGARWTQHVSTSGATGVDLLN